MNNRDDDFPAPGTVPYRPPSPDKIERAARWLRKLLSGGPLAQIDIKQQAAACGIDTDLLGLAKKQLGLIVENWNDQNPLAKFKVWFWRLPKPQGLFAEDE